MSAFDFLDEEDSKDSEPEVVQRMERSLNFWAEGKEDYPPAVRGAIALLSDLRPDVREMVVRIGRYKSNSDVELKRIVWFEDKNEKLDEACEEAKSAFRPFRTNADGLISTSSKSNPVLEDPSRHRLVVSDEFAKTNYKKKSDDLFLDDDEEDEIQLTDKSWQRKITQTLKPWAISKDGEIVRARQPDDLMLTLNAICSRTKHGWLSIDLFKVKTRRGSVLTYAYTYESQKKGEQSYQFMLELYGAAAEYNARLGRKLQNVGCLFLEIDESGEVYVTKVSTNKAETDGDTKVVEIPLDVSVVHEDGMPSQLRLNKTGNYYEAKLKPLVDKGKKLSTKIDLSKSSSESKSFRFCLRLNLDGPLLVASSGNAVLFQLNEMTTRFCGNTLMKLRSDQKS